MTAKKIESKVADAILQRTKEIGIGGAAYNVAPPTTATLILVSELVAQMPQIKLDAKNILSESLLIAKDCRVLGDIAAVLILGAKNLRQKKTIERKGFWGLFCPPIEVVIDKQAELSGAILQSYSPKKLNELIIELLTGMEISDFFGLSTSLIEVNLTRATREVEKTTASGHKSQE